MFGPPSLTKLLLLAGIILAVWYGFKIVGRLEAARKAEARLRHEAAARRASRNEPSTERVQELVSCPRCGAYVTPGTRCTCDR